jgi:hypothetical protein
MKILIVDTVSSFDSTEYQAIYRAKNKALQLTNARK